METKCGVAFTPDSFFLKFRRVLCSGINMHRRQSLVSADIFSGNCQIALIFFSDDCLFLKVKINNIGEKYLLKYMKIAERKENVIFAYISLTLM